MDTALGTAQRILDIAQFRRLLRNVGLKLRDRTMDDVQLLDQKIR